MHATDIDVQTLYRYYLWLTTLPRTVVVPVDTSIGPHPLVAHIERVIGRAGWPTGCM